MFSERLRRFVCSEQNQAGKSLIMAGNTAKKSGASDTELAKNGAPKKVCEANFFGERRNSGMSALPTFFKNKKVGTSDMELVPTMERLMGVEPTCQAWEACILPMNYSRIFF